MSTPVSGWRLPLRMARRDALRHKARSALVLVMIALPVTAVTAADVLIKTQGVSSVESLDRRLGTAAALVTATQGNGPLDQGIDPDRGYSSTGDAAGSEALPTADQVSGLLGGARLLELRSGDAQVRIPTGRTTVQAFEVDLRDPLTHGLVRLTDGRLPRAVDEVVINRALADKGYAVGDRLDLGGAVPTNPTVVGIAESTTERGYPFAVGPLGALGVEHSTQEQWLVGGGPVSWTTVRAVNKLGATVLSRSVVEHPPPSSQVPQQFHSTGRSSSTLAVLALIAIMALIEVVLLAGPAFAVGARKQQRSLALMSATGGTPAQARRVVVSSALVLGTVAAAAGVGLGLVAARLVEPLLQAHSDTWFGPWQVVWSQVAAVAGFGLLSAFLAAVVPAWIASRQDVVAVLAGRRGDRAPSLRSPLLGLGLLGVGILGSALGARGSGPLLIAASAIPSILGMVLLVPVVVAGVAGLSRRLPLVLRYAVRDAARHRTRTVPAIAAVAATVSGIVAVSIGISSDQKAHEATYQPTLTHGTGIVTSYQEASWPALEALVDRDLPGATVTAQQGIDDNQGTAYVDSQVRVPGRASTLVDSSGSALGSILLASDGPLPVGMIGLTRAGTQAAAQALASGTSVAFYTPDHQVDVDHVTVVRRVLNDQGAVTSRTSAVVPAVLVQAPDNWIGPIAILSPSAAGALGVTPTTVALTVTGREVSKDQETKVSEGVAGLSTYAAFYVERGYRPDTAALIAQWILIGMGAALMLGGTLTATFLALSDARPDLATLAAVGAAPRTRRGVAGAYAVVVGLVGAALGTVVGFIPGIAVTYPLTQTTYGTGQHGATGPFLDIPWLTLLVLVVALPLVTAAVVALCARSRLPLVSRLD